MSAGSAAAGEEVSERERPRSARSRPGDPGRSFTQRASPAKGGGAGSRRARGGGPGAADPYHDAPYHVIIFQYTILYYIVICHAIAYLSLAAIS